MTQLTEHISLEEMQQSHHGIDNTCPDEFKDNLQKAADKAEQARGILSDAAGVECHLRITYGYRCAAENTACGSTTQTSAHSFALATDSVPDPDLFTLRKAWDALRQHPTFMDDVDQLIIERGCIHIDLPVETHNFIARHELRTDITASDGTRHYPLWAIWPNEGND